MIRISICSGLLIFSLLLFSNILCVQPLALAYIQSNNTNQTYNNATSAISSSAQPKFLTKEDSVNASNIPATQSSTRQSYQTNSSTSQAYSTAPLRSGNQASHMQEKNQTAVTNSTMRFAKINSAATGKDDLQNQTIPNVSIVTLNNTNIIDEINGLGGLMSITGFHHPVIPVPRNPLKILERHPAHILRVIGHSTISLSGGYAPQIIWSAYGFNSLRCTHTTTTDWTDPNLCGHGQTIAIVDAYDDPNIASDLQTFDDQFGLPSCTTTSSCFVKSVQPGTQTDSGWVFEESLDVEWAHAIAPGAKIVLVESINNTLGNLLGGESMAVATGAEQVSNSWGGSEFSGESTYDSYFDSSTANFFVSSGDGGAGVDWPAASPYVISVGGTELNVTSSGDWSSETAWIDSGGGLSTYEPKPAYQDNFLSGNQRGVPDVAYDGDPNTGVYVYDSVPMNGKYGWYVAGGTSAGAPQWAGISAIANSMSAKLSSASFGTSNALYGAAAGAESNPQTNPYISNYHDIVSGSNGNCGTVCNAGPGYDEVTGLGSPQANNLISYITPATCGISLSQATITYGTVQPRTAPVNATNNPTSLSNTGSTTATLTVSGGNWTGGTNTVFILANETAFATSPITSSVTPTHLDLNGSPVTISSSFAPTSTLHTYWQMIPKLFRAISGSLIQSMTFNTSC